jgi:formylglycine-generating enzyme required for sulfatase activity
MSRPLHVFLCHASQDKPAVWKMYRFLKQRGMQPWLDQADLLPGQNWEVEIPKALFASDVILVCLSKNSINKEGYVQKEIVFALDKALEKPEGTIFVIPAKLEECEVPRRLGMYQWVDYFRPDGRKRLLLSLSLRAEGLGGEVEPVILEDTRRRKSAPKPAMPSEESLEKPKHQVDDSAPRSVAETVARVMALERLGTDKGEEEDRETVELARRQTSASTPEKEKLETPKAPKNVAKPSTKVDPRLLWLGSVILIGMLLFGINALLNSPPASPPEAAVAPTSTHTKTPTNIPSTHTNTPSPTVTPTPGLGSIYLSDGVTMLYVPAGTFSMGSETSSDEKPIHAINLSAYYMDKYEVTNAAYKRCVEAGVCDLPKQSRSSTRTAYYGNPEFDEYPVIFVDWNMANAYCEWRGTHLPTEAEWEKAARGTDGRTYPWGKDISCDKANYKNCVGDTTKVGSYLDGVSPYGMYDMAGNVWEWAYDWYDSSYYQISPSLNPQGPTSGQSRVLRGGSWNYLDNYVRTAYRVWYDPTVMIDLIGFRCSLSHP